ncbi:signal recognition particle-docking protein FtsY [Blattabacterium cuenoti]|uniref:signal recognition particle-docking protein FtsY n=1 Tax=Blattabacterium cuenoti TaxID=1653831 RepID=UPI00163CF779|nr:signal recognition particle-docking protein FtsY [Blattabacterium cuenoti]
MKKIKNDNFFYKIKKFFFDKEKNIINKSDIDHIEKILLSADIGTNITIKIVSNLENRIKNDNIKVKDLKIVLKNDILNIIKNKNKKSLLDKIKISKKPYVIMIIGINGVGKTTTIGKLSFLLKQNGYNPIIGASDTFRESAIEQLEILSNRSKVELIKQKIHSDPASVSYDTIQAAISRKKDVVLIDTAGRLHNRVNLMKELSKIDKVIKKLIPEAPHETILILDANTGQNAFEQTKNFSFFTKISSIIITKMDGSAKGGFILKILNEYDIPIQYIGTGENLSDLKKFNEEIFIDKILKK